MASYGYLDSLSLVIAMVVPHGILEAVQSPGTQAAVAEAAPRHDAAAAQGLAEASGSAAAAFGAFTAAPLFDGLGAGPAWLIAALVMAGLLTTSSLVHPPSRSRPRIDLDPAEQEAVGLCLKTTTEGELNWGGGFTGAASWERGQHIGTETLHVLAWLGPHHTEGGADERGYKFSWSQLRDPVIDAVTGAVPHPRA